MSETMSEYCTRCGHLRSDHGPAGCVRCFWSPGPHCLGDQQPAPDAGRAGEEDEPRGCALPGCCAAVNELTQLRQIARECGLLADVARELTEERDRARAERERLADDLEDAKRKLRYRSQVIDEHQATVADLTAQLAAAQRELGEIAACGIEYADPRSGYVVVQIDRPSWEMVQRYRAAPADGRGEGGE